MKTQTVKLARWQRIILGVAVVVAVIAFLLSFDFAAEPLANALKTTTTRVKNTAKGILMLAVGTIVAVTGFVFIGIPILGALIIAVGLALMAVTIWPMFLKSGLPRPGQKPPGTKL